MNSNTSPNQITRLALAQCLWKVINSEQGIVWISIQTGWGPKCKLVLISPTPLNKWHVTTSYSKCPSFLKYNIYICITQKWDHNLQNEAKCSPHSSINPDKHPKQIFVLFSYSVSGLQQQNTITSHWQQTQITAECRTETDNQQRYLTAWDCEVGENVCFVTLWVQMSAVTCSFM